MLNKTQGISDTEIFDFDAEFGADPDARGSKCSSWASFPAHPRPLNPNVQGSPRANDL